MLTRAIVITGFWTVIYFFIKLVLNISGLSRLKMVEQLLFGIIGSLFILSIIYKNNWFKRMASKKSGLAIIYISLATIALFFAYAHNVTSRGKELYDYVIDKNKRGWKGKMHESDSI